jgi:hypothetical protein
MRLAQSVFPLVGVVGAATELKKHFGLLSGRSPSRFRPWNIKRQLEPGERAKMLSV